MSNREIVYRTPARDLRPGMAIRDIGTIATIGPIVRRRRGHYYPITLTSGGREFINIAGTVAVVSDN